MTALLRMPGTIDRFIRLPIGPMAPGPLHRHRTGRHAVRRPASSPATASTGRAPSASSATRDIEVEEEAEDLVRFFETALKRRRRGSVIRLEIEAAMPEPLCAAGRRGARRDQPTRSSSSTALLALNDLAQLVAIDRPDAQVPALYAALPGAHPRPSTATAWRPSARRTSSSTTPTNRSTWWSSSCARRRPTRTSSPSSRRSTAPPTIRRSPRRSPRRRRPASR